MDYEKLTKLGLYLSQQVAAMPADREAQELLDFIVDEARNAPNAKMLAIDNITVFDLFQISLEEARVSQQNRAMEYKNDCRCCCCKCNR
jgi:hypothetical protein